MIYVQHVRILTLLIGYSLCSVHQSVQCSDTASVCTQTSSSAELMQQSFNQTMNKWLCFQHITRSAFLQVASLVRSNARQRPQDFYRYLTQIMPGHTGEEIEVLYSKVTTLYERSPDRMASYTQSLRKGLRSGRIRIPTISARQSFLGKRTTQEAPHISDAPVVPARKKMRDTEAHTHQHQTDSVMPDVSEIDTMASDFTTFYLDERDEYGCPRTHTY